MKSKFSLDNYFTDFQSAITEFLKVNENKNALESAVNLINSSRKKSKIFTIGNGGSAPVAEHIAIDLTKNAGLNAVSFSSASTVTTFANDYGYENLFKKGLEHYANKGDILIAISGTGTSKNILKACNYAKENGIKIITLSGFNFENPLFNLGDINLWINSKAFGYLEIIHTLLLHYINDAIIGNSEYMIR